MRIRSVRREMRLLRIFAISSTVIATIALIGAAQGMRDASFGTITVHRIDVIDREGKLAMVLASHDDEATPVIRGYTAHRSQGNNADNGIVFFNQKGDEQGASILGCIRRPHTVG